MKRILAVNERGLRVGEDHQNAKLTNEEVNRIRELHREGLSYRTLAMKFDVSKGLIARICRYELRVQTVIQWKTVHIPEIKA